MTFYSRRRGGGFEEYENIPIVAAPKAGASSGRLMAWSRCHSCALFPKPDGLTNIKGGSFGTSMVVAVSSDDTELLVVGSPTLGDGQVALIPAQAYRRWDGVILDVDGMTTGVRECQCNFDDNVGPLNGLCIPWDGTLQGSFDSEEFGASLAAGDLDCDGIDDLAIGAPGATLPTNGPDLIADAGAVYVYESSEGPLGDASPTVLRQGSLEVGGDPESSDRFGQTLLFGNFNGARRLSNDYSCYDLVVATPGQNEGAGEIQIFEGSPQGLVYGGPVIQLSDIFDMASDPGDLFGHSLTAGDLNRDGFDDLVIGAPGDGLGGSVVVIPGSPQGLAIEDAASLTQGGAYSGVNEPGDQFGFAVSWTNLLGNLVPGRGLVVGVPGEDDGRGQIRIYRTTDTPPDFGPLSFNDLAVFDQGDILGDTVPGDRFGSVLMHTRAFPDFPFAP